MSQCMSNGMPNGTRYRLLLLMFMRHTYAYSWASTLLSPTGSNRIRSDLSGSKQI